MEPFQMGTVVTLSDSSDEEQLPLMERILMMRKNEQNKIEHVSSQRHIRSSSAHSMSDSEDSDSGANKAIEINLGNDCQLLNQNSVPLLTSDSLKFCETSKPLLTLDILVSDTEESHKVNAETEKAKTENFKKTSSKRVKDAAKEEEKIQKFKMREEKKREKEFAKALKASEKEILKAQKPEECIKNMKIVIDHNVIFQDDSQAVFSALDGNNVKYSIEESDLKFSVIWFRTITDVTVENCQILKEESEKRENILLLFIPNEDFLKMVHSSVQEAKGKNNGKLTLLDHIVNIKTLFPELDVTCVIIGFNQYIRNIKDGDKSVELKALVKQISKSSTEEVITEVQLQTYVNFNFINNMTEFGNLLCRFTKAIAEAPHRKEKLIQKSLAFSWYADADSCCPAKVAKDGSGLIKLWQQQVQQFQNVSPEVAEAVVSKYPSPQLLMKAYKNCKSTKEAEMLLQDIVVRRNYGPLGTQRRIGPELSFKIYLFFTSRDGNQVLHR